MLKITSIPKKNRGRIQAQGGKCEKSEAWNCQNVLNKKEGKQKLDSLEMQLTRKEKKERCCCLNKTSKFILNAPISGYDISRKSFTPTPPLKDIRVDVEIIKGKAFCN